LPRKVHALRQNIGKERPWTPHRDGSNSTLRIDVNGWFRAPSGALNPRAPTDVLYPQIAANVANSFKLFRDNAKKGHDDGT